jgi:hypothetical protein
MPIEIHMSEQSISVALVMGGTAVAVACVN